MMAFFFYGFGINFRKLFIPVCTLHSLLIAKDGVGPEESLLSLHLQHLEEWKDQENHPEEGAKL